MALEVAFAVPIEVSCSLCGNRYERGCCVFATKRVLSVSQAGYVTWLFSVACSDCTCSGSLKFSSDPSKPLRFVPCGDAVALADSRPGKRPQSVGAEASDATSALKAITSRCSVAERSDEASALHSLMKRQSWAHADTAATADVMLAFLDERWDATPSKPVAHDRVGKGVKRRKEARGVAKRINRASKTPLACQRATVGRMSRSQFSAARLAVRSLHRGGALDRVVSASREGGECRSVGL